MRVAAGERMGVRAELCRARRCEFIRASRFFHQRGRMNSALQPIIVIHCRKAQ